ncbi:DeoR/GlpR family DNA-binding transcription regulator [Megasphaera sp. WILCCON 0056]|uniref:DeoR/GlpR family DNA-binding transcription regulator n=1 Tax=Megasphaera sp. WILCCON 0056 TaxID=3345340 RepID=UPI003A808D2F
MLSEQRYHVILKALDEKAIVKTYGLSKMMGTTRETVRRDLIALEKKGLLKRIRGGAMKISNTQDSLKKNNSYVSFDKRKMKQYEYKEDIVKEAAKTIHDGQIIALDSGTTALLLAQEIKGKFHFLSVVTNSLAIANELADAPEIELILTGGIYRDDEKAFIAGVLNLDFSKIHIDTFYLTTCGISVEAGITYQRMDEIPIQNQLMEAADKTIVIADATKLGINSLVRMCGIDRISKLITDVNIDKEQKEKFENAGVKIIVALPEGADSK